MTEPVRKLAFFEINHGNLGKEMQQQFEGAAITARDLNGVTSVILTINVYPPERDTSYGQIDYQIKVKEPPVYKSAKMVTVLKEGVIVSDGRDLAESLQLGLDLEFAEKTVPMKVEASHE